MEDGEMFDYRCKPQLDTKRLTEISIFVCQFGTPPAVRDAYLSQMIENRGEA